MSENKGVGLIECGATEKSFVAVSAAIPETLVVKKAFVFHESAKSSLQNRFPSAVIAANCEDILQDDSIQHVLISAPSDQHRNLIGAALKAKKHVQIV